MLTKKALHDSGEQISSSRRNFIGKIGGVAGITALAVACQKSVNSSSKLNDSSVDDGSTGFGQGDIAILNYAYLLEQLEAAFYITVASSFYSGATDWEKRRLNQIRDHETAHREFFKTALGSSAIDELEFDFSSVDFTNRTSVLTNAQTFEDTGVSAYNFVAYLIVNPEYLLAAGKIVSVEARHASYIRELVKINSFADSSVVKTAGLDLSNPPKVVLEAVKPFIKSNMNMNGFPM